MRVSIEGPHARVLQSQRHLKSPRPRGVCAATLPEQSVPLSTPPAPQAWLLPSPRQPGSQFCARSGQCFLEVSI